MKLPKPDLPLRTTLLYLLFGGLWILLSDQLLSHFVLHNAQQAFYQTLKGWFFILLSSTLLYLFLLRDDAERKLAEEALRISEQRYRLITQNSQDLIWTMNLELQLTYVSPMVERALGYSAEEILASLPERFLTPESYALGISVFREEVEKAQGQPDPNYARVLELEYRRRNGTTFWVEMKFSPFRDSNERAISVLGVGRDITERKIAEKEIRAKSKELAALLDAGQSLTESLNLSEVLQKITDKTIDIMGIERAAIYLIDSENLYLGACTPPLPPEFPEVLRRAVLADHPHIAEALASGLSVILPDAASAALTVAEQRVRDALGLRTIIYIPLITRKDTVGILILETVGQPREFSENERHVAQALSNQAALVIANATLYENLSRYVKELENQIEERRQAQEEILSLSKFPDENPNPVLRIAQNGRLLYANPASTDLLKTWKREVGQNVPKEWHEYLSRALESGRNTEVEVESAGKCYSCVLSPIQGSGYINVYCYDITKRKLAEAELISSEERFRLLFENNHTVMMLIEPVSGAIQKANLAATKFYGYSLAELCTMNINDINQLSPDEVYTERMRALREEKNFFNFQHRLSNGEIRSVEVHSAPMELGGHKLLFSIVYDVTDRKQAEEQIQRQLKQLNALHMIDIAISSSFDLNIILDVVLQQVLPLLGVDATAVILFNSQLQTIEYAASRGFRSNAIHCTKLRLGEGYASQAVLKRKTIHISGLMETGGKLAKTLQLAHEEFVDYYGTPLIVKGEVKGVLEIYHRSYLKVDRQWLEFLETLAGQAAIAIDNAQLFENLQRSNFNLEGRVAERTAELNRANTELEHASRIKDEFLANMSHELRTPLTSILGLSESLLEQRRGSLNDRQQRSVEVIESSGQHLLELINDILDLSKIEAGKFDYYPQPISVDEICKSSLSFVKSMAAKKSITVTYIQDIHISRIYADPRRLKQILVNLLTNAVKFTLNNGEVSLQVKADLEQDLIRFSVIDNGIGIASENFQRLFQPFVQVDSSLNRQYEGTGLGLALVQKLTDLHGGSVQVESEAGKGSRFTINLPCLQAELARLEKLESHPALLTSVQAENAGVPGETSVHLGVILLADDNMPSILTIGEYMESYGYEVVAAHDGLEAIQKAEVFQPDIILMDIQMPSMTGWEAIAHLRGNPQFKTTPIIALTALAMPGDRERSLLAGANEYMSKPVSLKVLAKTVETMLNFRKGISQ